MSLVSDALGLAVLAASLGVVALSLVLLRGRADLAHVLAGLAQVAFLPARRRRFLVLLVVEAILFLAAGTLLGLRSLGDLPFDPDVGVAVAFLGGLFAMGLLAWTALRPRVMTPDERQAMERAVPSVFESLWTVPFRVRESETGSDERR